MGAETGDEPVLGEIVSPQLMRQTMQVNYRNVAETLLIDTTTLEEKENLAKHWVTLRRQHRDISATTLISKMGLRNSGAARRKGLAVLSDLEDAGIGQFHAADPVIDGKEFMDKDAGFKVRENVDLTQLGQAILQVTGGDIEGDTSGYINLMESPRGSTFSTYFPEEVGYNLQFSVENEVHDGPGLDSAIKQCSGQDSI